MTRRPWRPGPALLGLGAGWVALFAWSGMVVQPGRFLGPTLLVGLVVVLAGSGLRVLGVASYAVASAQVVISLLSLNVVLAARESLLGVIPTSDSVRRAVHAVHNGALTLNAYTAPVEVNPTHTRALLMACGLAVIVSIDVLALGLQRPPLAALPLLVTLSIPVSILRGSLSLAVFVITALLFLRLLATEHLDRFARWDRRARSTSGRASAAQSSGPALSVLWQVAVAAVLLTLVAAPLVPVTDLLQRDRGAGGNGAGNGAGFQLTGVNPFIRMRRDLVEQTHTPLVYAQTTARSTSYLRSTVLDEFTGDEWRPSPRILPEANIADGTFPQPPGLSPGVGGTEAEWSLQLAPQFSTTWLPLPYPIRELSVPGSWRYDARTLDVAFVSGDNPPELRYRATAFTPSITAPLLTAAVPTPLSVLKPMTRVPDNLPSVIGVRAREVTRGATSDFAKAVALQDWFRDKGGFRYSLEQRGGSGMDLLAHFVTDDRVGYCEQFAAAMATMGRTLGIASRVVVGFLDGTTLKDGRVLYTSDELHAWPEMYFAGVGWVRFEPTPGQRAASSPAWTRQDTSSAAPSGAPSAASSEPVAPRPSATPAEGGADGQGGTSVPWTGLGALLVVLVLAIVPGVVRTGQRRRRLAGGSPARLVEGAWAELRATAIDLDLDWPDLRSPREQARTVAGQVPADSEALDSLESLLVKVERGRYGPTDAVEPVDADARVRTVATVTAWRRAMLGSVDRERGWRGRLWPASVVRSRRR